MTTRVLLLAAALVMAGRLAAQEDKARPRVAVTANTGGHTSAITSMAFTPDGKRLVTCEATKVHVWRIPGGELERTWRLPSGVEMIAVDPKGTTVAAMGNVEAYPVWLLDIATGGSRAFTIKGVSGHNHIRSLCFSPNGRRLAWGTWYEAGVIFLNGERVTHTFDRKGIATHVQFDKAGDRLFVVGGNPPAAGQADVFDAKPGGKKTTDPLFKLDDAKGGPALASWSPDDAYFAGWFKDRGSRVHLWKADGKKDDRRPVALPGDPAVEHLQFVGPDQLVAVGVTADKLLATRINARTRKVEKTGEFTWANPAGTDVVAALSAGGEYLAVTCSPGFRVRLYDLTTDKRLGDVGHAYASPQAVAWSPDSRSISWTLGTNHKGQVIPPRGLDLGTLKLLDGNDVAKFKSTPHIRGYRLDFDESKKRLAVVHAGKRVETTFDSPEQQHAFITDAAGKVRLVVLAKWGSRLSVIDPETGKVTDIDAYSGGTALAASPDGKHLLLARHDQVMTIYKLDDPIRVQLRILVAGRDWVVWTPRGYYAATFDGERMMGFTSKTDAKSPLTFYPADRFRKHLHRPELIKLVLEKGSVPAAMKATRTAEVEIETVLPPRTTLEVVKQAGDRVTVKAAAAAGNGKPVEALRLQLDGRSLPDGQGYVEPKLSVKAEATWEVTVPPGTHQLTVLARGSDASDFSNAVEVKVAEPPGRQPTLHPLTVGINYRWNPALDREFGWLDAAENDAGSLLAALAKNCTGPGNHFGAVAGSPLVGRAATKQAVLDGLNAIRVKGAKPGDLVVFFYAGHGVAEGREFYLLTADVDPQNVAKSCLSGTELRDALKAMPCQVLVILDACYAGQALDRFEAVTDEAGRALADDEAGITVVAAAMAHEKAGEKGGNGRLTAAVGAALALQPGAFFDREGKVMNVRHLHTRVEDIVRNQSRGKQNPTIFVPHTSPPIVLRRIPD